MSVTDMRVYKRGDKLTQKQQKWIDEYIKTDDLTTASRNAGYTAKTDSGLKSIGYENSLRFKDIIEERRKELNESITKNTIASLEEIQEFWTSIYKDKAIKDSDRLKASELLAKSKGGFIEKREIKTVNTDWFVDEANE